MKLYKDEKIAAMNRKMHNGFAVELTAYYMRKEKWANVQIPLGDIIEEGEQKGQTLVLSATVYYDYKKIPILSVGECMQKGDWLSYNQKKYIALSEAPQRRDFAKLQRVTFHLEKDKLIQFFETGKIDLPKWEEV